MKILTKTVVFSFRWKDGSIKTVNWTNLDKGKWLVAVTGYTSTCTTTKFANKSNSIFIASQIIAN